MTSQLKVIFLNPRILTAKIGVSCVQWLPAKTKDKNFKCLVRPAIMLGLKVLGYR